MVHVQTEPTVLHGCETFANRWDVMRHKIMNCLRNRYKPILTKCSGFYNNRLLPVEYFARIRRKKMAKKSFFSAAIFIIATLALGGFAMIIRLKPNSELDISYANLYQKDVNTGKWSKEKLLASIITTKLSVIFHQK